MAVFKKTRRAKKQSKARRKTMKRNKSMRGGGGDCPSFQFCKDGTCHDYSGRNMGTRCNF